jgi:SNF2 family DNA or RNA helicase
MIMQTDERTVHVEWDPQEKGLFLWLEDQNGSAMDESDLNHQLFAWHEASFYGTFIPTFQSGSRHGILLSPSLALDFFSAPPHIGHLPLEDSVEAMKWRDAANSVRTALAAGDYQPDYAVWKAGGWGWKLTDQKAAENPLVHLFLNQLLAEWTSQTKELSLLWDQVVFQHPSILHPADGGEDIDEEEWLQAIGWTRDDTPFSIALQLDQPVEDSYWHLRLMLQSRENDGIWVECGSSGTPLDEAKLPDRWRPHMAKAAKEMAKITQMIPWLSDQPSQALLSRLDDEQALRFLREDSMQLTQKGVSVLLPEWWEKLRLLKPRLRAHVKAMPGSRSRSLVGLEQIMQYDWKIAIGDLELSQEEFQHLLEQKNRLVQIRKNWITADITLLKYIAKTIRKAEMDGLSLQEVLEADWTQDPTAAKIEMEVEWDASAKLLLEPFLQPEKLPMIEPPAALQATLRPYQIRGMSWLLFLRKLGLGGCLADDMGLGKTIQFIAYLLHQKETRKQSGPSLLICPTSVLGNWQKEVARFAPSLQVYLHYGANRAKGEAFAKEIFASDLVITSYTLAHLDGEELQPITWHSICLDEAQNVKNAQTKQAAAVRQLNAGQRIALTGTPIENRLAELWSIFSFINPGYLGSLRQFNDRFVSKIEKDQDVQATRQLQRLIRPLMLRRTKNDPAIRLDLPEKFETKEYIALTAEQAALYESTTQGLFEKLEELSPMERRGLILAVLTKLKQICNHPGMPLKESSMTRWQGRSGKIERLLEIVDELRGEGDRCLIFTQFVGTGHLLKQIIEQERKESVLFLHGGTTKAKRDAMIQEFQDPTRADKNGIFILSLKAGGTGLNLTGANHVVHFDRWWNPAVENQATDRAYRIGQERNVQVHKFITLGTLEERIDEMIERKQGLSGQIVGSGEQWISEMTTEELKDLFALRNGWT